MTELETIQRAKMYMDKLAQGIDPITNQMIPGDSALNNDRLARCFCYVSGVLEQVIANNGMIANNTAEAQSDNRKRFFASEEQLKNVQISPEPIHVGRLTELISAAVEDAGMKRLGSMTITNWLSEKGYLEKQPAPDGKNRRMPTEKGFSIGLTVGKRQSQYGEYQAVFYNADAQRFVLDNLPEMLSQK